MRLTQSQTMTKPFRISLYAMAMALAIVLTPGTSQAKPSAKGCEHGNSDIINEKCADFTEIETYNVPEPASLPLISAGLLVLMGMNRRKNRQ